MQLRSSGQRIVSAMTSHWLGQKLHDWTIELHSAAAEGDVNFMVSLLDVGDTEYGHEEYSMLGFIAGDSANSRSMDGGEPLLSVAVVSRQSYGYLRVLGAIS